MANEDFGSASDASLAVLVSFGASSPLVASPALAVNGICAEAEFGI